MRDNRQRIRLVIPNEEPVLLEVVDTPTERIEIWGAEWRKGLEESDELQEGDADGQTS